MTADSFSNLDEAVADLAPALAGVEPCFDVEGFAREVTERRDGRLRYRDRYAGASGDRFWWLVEQYNDRARQSDPGDAEDI